MPNFYSELVFEKIGADKDFKMSVDTTNMEMIWKVVEDELADRGFVRHNLAYTWLVDGTNICIAKILSTGGIIAKFRINTRVRREYRDQEDAYQNFRG